MPFIGFVCKFMFYIMNMFLFVQKYVSFIWRVMLYIVVIFLSVFYLGAFVGFMCRVAKVDELASIGSRLLTGFRHALGEVCFFFIVFHSIVVY